MSSSALKIETASVYAPLLQASRYKGAHGGRGSGKSHFFAELAVERCLWKPGTRIVCLREVQKSLKESVKRLVEDKIQALGVGRRFQVQHDQIRTPGNGVILFQGMQDHTAESIKSLEGFDAAYFEEAQTMTERSLEFLRPTIRKPDSELWFSWNRRHPTDPVDVLLTGEKPPPDSIVVQANWRDNPFFPAVLEEERLFDQEYSPGRYEHIWEGDYEPVAIGAIWDRATIQQYRVRRAPDIERILVAVDPAVSADKGSNETGIIVCGVGRDSRGYVLDDQSLVGTPQQWARQAIACFDYWEADNVVVEVNQGGDMVKHTLQSIRPELPIKEVRATRGKHVRAEPISALYSLGKISHVGTYSELENQMCMMTPDGYQGHGSPDRVDALVWALTGLFSELSTQDRLERDRPVRVIRSVR